MRKTRSMIGMPVVVHRKKIGRLIHADISSDLKRMDGIWVDCGLLGTRYIPAEQLKMIGEMTILADSSGKRRRCKAEPLFLRAVCTCGSRLGAVTEAEIDELSFLVHALEISRGLWNDFWAGRTLVTEYSINTQRNEVIIGNSATSIEKEDCT